ncbi:MAG: hypothetical protein C0601_06340 [Candidatus Muiribacterium halophilum]|uniref:Hemerythrin-like domain-containing protein n=1 Tax=Muiribacterium halophilum TaxID=2053465 RepID=A0A2N5ZGA0_MUIH1|nr:MAG: hypothetical protein C0601_06340 [Candidatus Muirbacterium halophilum]
MAGFRFSDREKSILASFDNLSMLIDSNSNLLSSRDCFYDLATTIVSFFDSEERYMISNGFEFSDEHIREHEKVRKLLLKIIRDIDKGICQEAIKEIYNLKTILLRHFTREDKRLSDFQIERSRKISESIPK